MERFDELVQDSQCLGHLNLVYGTVKSRAADFVRADQRGAENSMSDCCFGSHFMLLKHFPLTEQYKEICPTYRSTYSSLR